MPPVNCMTQLTNATAVTPWTEFGKVPATVASVGSEPRSGHVRVELTIDPNPPSGIPLQHGLPATAEVEVDSISPAALALRAVGKILMPGKGGE